jgi:alpha-ketoglutarate-dependent taurine dioxygenase|tara:strand:+ start:477 stop:1442 length:966 start_codon:yes stop_codon:yes gene_type:complete
MRTLQLSEQIDTPSGIFPLIYDGGEFTSLSASIAWAQKNHSELIDLAFHHGAVLFRNFATETDHDFDRFIQAFNLENFHYEQSLSNAVRFNRTERVFTANEAPADVKIFLHHEMAQTPFYPSRLFFFCEQPAETGGATPICRSDVLVVRLQEQHPQFIADLITKGLKYRNILPDQDDPQSGMGRSWRSTFHADTPEQCEANMAEIGYTGEWRDDGSLVSTTPVLDGIRSLADGRQTFFNQLIAAYRGWGSDENSGPPITYGDGTPLDHVAVTAACEIADELTFNVPWQQGDIVLVDNYVTMHARQTFTGTRKILASLVAVG